MTNNVIQFPKPFYSPEERSELRKELLIDVALDLSLSIFNKLDIYTECLEDPDNLQVDFTPENRKDMILIHEAIKSCLYRLHNKEHPLQGISEEYMPEVNELHFEMPDSENTPTEE